MNISEKIEEIRRQPEHIRLRWVWGLTTGFMVVIIFLWLILLKSQTFNFSQNLSPNDQNLSTEFDQQKKSIKDAVGQLKGAVSNAPQQNVSATENDPNSSN